MHLKMNILCSSLHADMLFKTMRLSFSYTVRSFRLSEEDKKQDSPKPVLEKPKAPNKKDEDEKVSGLRDNLRHI